MDPLYLFIPGGGGGALTLQVPENTAGLCFDSLHQHKGSSDLRRIEWVGRNLRKGTIFSRFAVKCIGCVWNTGCLQCFQYCHVSILSENVIVSANGNEYEIVF